MGSRYRRVGHPFKPYDELVEPHERIQLEAARDEKGHPVIPDDMRDVVDLIFKINNSLTQDRYNRKFQKKKREWAKAKMEAVRNQQPIPPEPVYDLPTLDEMRSPEIRERQDLLDALFESRLGKFSLFLDDIFFFSEIKVFENSD